MIVLGIETSCDETAAALVEDGRRVLSSIVASQMEEHARFGGVVPEVASRRHVEEINRIIRTTLSDAGKRFADIEAIAVTNRPGLLGALLVGVSAAKAMAMALRVPLVGVHHIEAHLYANFLSQGDVSDDIDADFPAIALVVSGGHTDLFHIHGHGNYELLGRTRDDAAGEAFDKCARLMGLSYPGGPAIQNAARSGDARAVPLPRAWLPGTNEFSFSGLKTAVRNALLADPKPAVADIAASFQESVAEVLTRKTVRAAQERGIQRIFLAGGVAANARLRETMSAACVAAGIRLFYPSPTFCTDNGAMIAATGYYYLQAGRTESIGLDLTTIASEPLVRFAP